MRRPVRVSVRSVILAYGGLIQLYVMHARISRRVQFFHDLLFPWYRIRQHGAVAQNDLRFRIRFLQFRDKIAVGVLEDLALFVAERIIRLRARGALRVIVGADKIDDKQTENLSGEIAKKIQDEMTYPGQVKITVIRETRAVSYAK